MNSLKNITVAFALMGMLTIPLGMKAQTGKNGSETFSLGVHFSGQSIFRNPQPAGSSIDFMNYLGDGKPVQTCGLINLVFGMNPVPGWTISTTLSINSSMAPGHMQISVMHLPGDTLPGWHFGWKTSLVMFPRYLNEFNRFHIERDSLLFADLNHNYRQRLLYDASLRVMPVAAYRGDKIRFRVAAGPGIAVFMPFSERIEQKKPDGNFRRTITYETEASPAAVLAAETEVYISLFRFRHTEGGLLLRAGSLLSYRQIRYRETVRTWTAENAETRRVSPGRQFSSLTEAGGGFYVNF